MAAPDEIALARLLRALPPPPDHGVQAAKAVPRVQRLWEEVLPRLEASAAARAGESADLERALREAGAEPDPVLVAAARRRLAES